MATLFIDAMAQIDVAIFDVPRAFPQNAIPADKFLMMRIRDEFVDVMSEVNPEYIPYVRYDNGKKVLYLKILRYIYGCIESALLWYKLYSETLEGMGFFINPYDRCVANKMIKGKQCTIVWYVDDNKLYHIDPNLVTDILEEIKKHFGELVISRGDKHDFLGMKVKLSKGKLVELSMTKQFEEAIEIFGSICGYGVKTPGVPHLWELNENAERLDTKNSKIFHSVASKILYVTKQKRPDI